jgi:hypothetical protein
VHCPDDLPVTIGIVERRMNMRTIGNGLFLPSYGYVVVFAILRISVAYLIGLRGPLRVRAFVGSLPAFGKP